MARRIILGKDSSGYRFRVSQPGVDAATAGLDELIFDADNIPARVAATGLATIGGAAGPTSPTTVSLAHGASPSLCIGVASSLHVLSGAPGTLSTPTGGWARICTDPAIDNGAPFPWWNQVSEMVGEWVTPFLYQGDDSAGLVVSCGWGISWSSNQVNLVNRSGYSIRVRWAALEF